MDPDLENSASDIPDEFKTALAKLYEFLHGKGVTRSLFLEGLKQGGYSVGPRTLDRWVHYANTRGLLFSKSKRAAVNIAWNARNAMSRLDGTTIHL